MPGLSFLYPLFLIGVAAVAIPIALHLFRRRTNVVVDFPAVRLLHRSPLEHHRRRRLRELILLALRVTALVLLALAFGRPYVDGGSAALAPPVTVVALDTSLSLSAPGQFEAAKLAARRAVEEAPATAAVALVTFADAATLVVPPTIDRGGVLAAIEAASATAGGTRFRTALARAAEVVPGARGRIVVVTDLQQAGWEAGDEGSVADGVDVDVIEIASPAGNIAVTAVRRERDGVTAAIHNFGSRPVRAPVRLSIDGKEVLARTVDVAPQAAAEVLLPAALPSSGGASVTVVDPDGYQADNARHLVLDPAGAVPVLVITAEPPGSSNAGLYVERALSVADDGRAFHADVIDGRTFSALPGGADAPRLQAAGALVVLATTTLDRTGRQMVAAYLAAGGRVLVTLGPDLDLDTLADTVGTTVDVAAESADTPERTVTLVAVDGRHPIFRPFLNPSGALGDIYVARYRRLNPQDGRTVLARFSGAGSALTEQRVGGGRLLLFASDLDNQWNRFPLNPAFVPWLVEMARYLTQGREQRQSFTVPDVPFGVPMTPGIHDTPGARGSDQAPAAASAAVAPGRVAVNTDVRESNPARTSLDEFTAAITRLNQVEEVQARAEARQQEEQQRLWQLGLVVMFLALASEGFIGRKAI